MPDNSFKLDLAKNNYHTVELVSANYLGKKFYESDGKQLESKFHTERDTASDELKLIAAYWGYDMVVNVAFEKEVEEEESESGKGVHYNTVWKCRGIGAKIKTKFSKKK